MGRLRARKGEGYVYEGSDGRWKAVLSTTGPDGKRKKTFAACKKSGPNSEAAAGELLFAMRAEAQEFQGRLQRTEKSSLAAFLDEWLQIRKASGRLAASTQAEYNRIIKKITPHTGKIRMGTIDELAIEQLYATMKRQGMGDADREKMHNIIHGALKAAVKWRRLPHNPADNVEKPKFKGKKQKALTDQEVVQLVQSIDPDSVLYLLVMLAVDSGMRMGEIFALRWANVDQDNGLIHVEESITEVNGKAVLGPPKSDAGVRVIQVSAAVRKALTGHKKALFALGRSGSKYVFPATTGVAMRRNNFYRSLWRPALCKAFGSHPDPRGPKPNGTARPPIPDKIFQFKHLRHTSATRLLERDVAAHVVAERMGHSKPSVTLNIYAHVTAKQRQAAANTMDDLMKESG